MISFHWSWMCAPLWLFFFFHVWLCVCRVLHSKSPSVAPHRPNKGPPCLDIWKETLGKRGNDLCLATQHASCAQTISIALVGLLNRAIMATYPWGATDLPMGFMENGGPAELPRATVEPRVCAERIIWADPCMCLCAWFLSFCCPVLILIVAFLFSLFLLVPFPSNLLNDDRFLHLQLSWLAATVLCTLLHIDSWERMQ